MKIIGVVPARYGSSRFPGKPLADICGKPMIWWVYSEVKKTIGIDDVYVATDDQRIFEECNKSSMKCLMTEKLHNTSTERVYEVAQRVDADLYVVVNGDEPLITPQVIGKILPIGPVDTELYVANLMSEVNNPAEVIDSSNIKIVTNESGNAMFMSRSPIPYPKKTISYKYYKHLGVLIYNYNALKFFANVLPGYNEKVEDINELRFIEHGIAVKMICVEAETLSVDTPKDLERVREIMRGRLAS